jgi:hypothetical protein
MFVLAGLMIQLKQFLSSTKVTRYIDVYASAVKVDIGCAAYGSIYDLIERG